MSSSPVQQSSNGAEMSFIEHLEELRWHLVRSLLAIVVISVVVFLSKDFIFSTVIFGPVDPGFFTYKALCRISNFLLLGGALCMDRVEFKFINIEMAAQFLVHLKVSFILGFVVAFPYVFWEFWRFISPGLLSQERNIARGIVFYSSLLFFCGIAFGYYILSPISLSFFGNYQVSEVVENNFTLSSYIAFLSMLVMASGIIFELPMVVYFLSKLGIITPQLMRSYRKHALLVILFISAVITPPDVGTQLLISIPVYFLYEMSIFISARVLRKKQKQQAEEPI